MIMLTIPFCEHIELALNEQSFNNNVNGLMAQFLLGNSIFAHLFRWINFVDCLLVRNIVVLLFFGQCEQWRRGGSPLRGWEH